MISRYLSILLKAIILIFFISICTFQSGYGGTYRNDSDFMLPYKSVTGDQKRAKPGETIESYEALDLLNVGWVKISDEPFYPLSYEYKEISHSTSGNYTVGIYLQSKYIYLINRGATSIKIHANTISNPFYWKLLPSSPNYDADEIKIVNKNNIFQLILEMPDLSGGNVTIVEVP